MYRPPSYNYCPMCGRLTQMRTIGDKQYQACSDAENCKWVHWGHTPTTVAVIIPNTTNRAEVLMVKRARDPFKDTWCLPCGFAEYGEIPAEAAQREALEETGLKVSVGNIPMFQVLEDSHPRTFSVLSVFVAFQHTGEAKANDDASDIKFVSVDKLPEIGFKKQIEAIERYKKMFVTKYDVGVDHAEA